MGAIFHNKNYTLYKFFAAGNYVHRFITSDLLNLTLLTELSFSSIRRLAASVALSACFLYAWHWAASLASSLIRVSNRRIMLESEKHKSYSVLQNFHHNMISILIHKSLISGVTWQVHWQFEAKYQSHGH